MAGPDCGVHWLRQVHGRSVVTVTGASRGGAGPGDALVCAEPGEALCVLVADCAPVVLASPEGVVGAVHAGWRGLAAGVVGAAAEAMAALGATDLEGAIGPCIHPCCYAFGAGDLDGLATALDPSVRGRTAQGEPALDLPAAVGVALARAGIRRVPGPDRCTGCAGGLFSHRARRDVARQALVAWRSPVP
ncbi:MAG: polyphenol oxidase family protein [Acidimicrobiales bacterium]|nr:polyphenol oxidase family protein [Acidimicrobiales bacterium]